MMGSNFLWKQTMSDSTEWLAAVFVGEEHQQRRGAMAGD